LKALVGDSEADELIQAAENGSSDVDTSKAALRKAFTALMKQPKDAVESMSKELLSLAKDNKITPGPSVNTTEELCELVQRCNSQFPADIGLFVLFFLNFVKLEPGQAMYLKADDIHAYISGDIIECMASSDNVIRAGFTPKFQDVDTLTDILTYDHDPPEQQLLQPADYPYVTLNTTAYSSNSECLLYDPPIEEFSVARTVLRRSGAKATFEGIAGPSIVICTSGSGKISVGPKSEEIKEGYVYFVGATAECVIESMSDEMVTFKAFCEIEQHEVNGKY
jgi:mannose-6-phosphate isomerase